MQFTKALRYIAVSGIFLLPLIPFIVSGSMFFPFITGKNFAFRIIAEIVFGSWAMLAILDRRYRPRSSILLWAVVSFVAIIGVADLFGENPSRSFWSNFERMEGYVTLLHVLGYFIAAASVLRTKKIWIRLFQTWIGASLLIIAYGFLQLLGKAVIHQGGVRLDATLGNATYLAVYMLFLSFITLWLMHRHRGPRWVHIFYGFLAASQITMLFLTATRGAVLGLLGGLLIALGAMAIFGQERPIMRRTAVGIIAALLVAVGIFMAARDTDFVRSNRTLSRLATISLSSKSAQSRFLIWEIAADGFQERPILGWGQEGFIYVFSKHYRSEMYAQEPWFDRAHNIFFDWLIAGGILGVIGYFAIHISALFLIWRRGAVFLTIERGILTGLIAAYLFHNLFVFDNVVSYILFFTIAAFIHAWATGENGTPMPAKSDSAPQLRNALAGIVGIATICTVYVVNVNGILQAQSLLSALSPQDGGPSKNLDYFKKSLELDVFGVPETREHLLRGAAQIALSDAPDDLKLAFAELAYKEMTAQAESDPNNARYPFFLGTFLSQFGQHEEAIRWLDKALAINPHKQLVLFEKASTAFNRGEHEEGLALFKEAYELAPEYDLAAVFYAVALIRLEQYERAEIVLTDAFATGIVNNSEILNAWAQVGRIDKVLEIWQLRAEQDPGNAQVHVSLARAYYDAGDRDSAIRAVEQALSLDAKFEVEGRALIEAIRTGTIK